MKLLIALSICYLGLCWADDECGALQRLMVKSQWGSLQLFGEDRTQTNIVLWKRFYRAKPDVKKFFTRVNGDNLYSPEMKGHMSRVYGGLDMVISLLDDDSTLGAVLSHLNVQHKDMGIAADYFTALNESLLDILGNVIGVCFDYAAWHACLNVVAKAITA